MTYKDIEINKLYNYWNTYYYIIVEKTSDGLYYFEYELDEKTIRFNVAYKEDFDDSIYLLSELTLNINPPNVIKK